MVDADGGALPASESQYSRPTRSRSSITLIWRRSLSNPQLPSLLWLPVLPILPALVSVVEVLARDLKRIQTSEELPKPGGSKLDSRDEQPLVAEDHCAGELLVSPLGVRKDRTAKVASRLWKLSVPVADIRGDAVEGDEARMRAIYSGQEVPHIGGLDAAVGRQVEDGVALFGHDERSLTLRRKTHEGKRLGGGTVSARPGADIVHPRFLPRDSRRTVCIF